MAAVIAIGAEEAGAAGGDGAERHDAGGPSEPRGARRDAVMGCSPDRGSARWWRDRRDATRPRMARKSTARPSTESATMVKMVATTPYLVDRTSTCTGVPSGRPSAV